MMTVANEKRIPSIKNEIQELLLRSLKVKYISESCKECIKTGNNYQSLKLGEFETAGFRTTRDHIFEQIDFEGRRVLDLGSNLGEISRTARVRGARLVDGFEYDPFFIELALLANAYNDVSRVSFFHRDITDPGVYTEAYDIVLAFSVFTYIRKVLPEISAVTREMLVLETHRLEDNLQSRYIAPVSRHFPHYRILGETEWGVRGRPEKRAIVAFARERETLDRLLRPAAASSGFPRPVANRAAR